MAGLGRGPPDQTKLLACVVMLQEFHAGPVVLHPFGTSADLSLLTSKHGQRRAQHQRIVRRHVVAVHPVLRQADRKSTRLNSSHANISYAVFCLKKNTMIVFTPTKS